MNSQESEIERTLNNAVPLPCSIDSMQLMFDAGVEEQKRKSKSSRRHFLLASSLSCLFLFSTVAMAAWNYQLVTKNSSLLATIQSIDSEAGSDQLSQDNSREKSPANSNRPTSDGQSGISDKRGEGRPAESTKGSSKSTRRNRQNNQLHYTYESTLTRRDSAVTTLLLRGVALRPEDEYRNPIQAGQREFLTSEEVRQGTEQSNINSRQRLQSDLLGL